MNIMIDKKYGLKSDENNIILYQLKVYGNKSKREGESYEEIVGYFRHLENALKRYKDVAIMSDDKSTTIKQVLIKLGSISKIIKGIKV